MDHKDYLVGIDVGSSKVVMAVGVRNEDKENISVLGVEVQEIDGCVKDGDIVNYIELGNAISKAKEALEKELGRRLNSAYVGVSGRSVYCVRYEDYVEISDKTGCVTENELRELNTRIEMVTPSASDVIIDRIPLRYRIDDRQIVRNPLGSYGKKLSATYLFVLAGKQLVDFVNRALFRADMKVCGLCVTPTIHPDLLLSEAEKEDGVAIVDIGGDLTDISVVREGKLCYFSSLPIGASSINDDLQEFLRTTKKNVDPLKRKYGSAIAECVPDDTTVPVKTAGHAKKQILQRNIAEIAEERLKDIVGFVARELKAANFLTKIPGGVVLTGGSAYLENIDRLFARELQMEVRLGSMLYGIDDNSQESVSAFAQASVIGLLLYGAKHNACETMPEYRGATPTAVPTPENKAGDPTDIFTLPREEYKVENPTTTPVVEVEKPQTPQPLQPTGTGPDAKERKIENKEGEEQTEVEVNEKPKKESLSSRFKGFMNRFRNRVDDMFTDEYI